MFVDSILLTRYRVCIIMLLYMTLQDVPRTCLYQYITVFSRQRFQKPDALNTVVKHVTAPKSVHDVSVASRTLLLGVENAQSICSFQHAHRKREHV